MRDCIQLTDEQIEAIFDELGYEAKVENLTFTRESIADFKSALNDHYVDGNIVSEGGYGGSSSPIHKVHYLVMTNCQPRKKDPHRDVVVVDFGAVTAVAMYA